MIRPTPPLNILIVEDEMLIVMDIETIIEDAGHRIVGEVASTYDLAALNPVSRPDLAFVDLHLARGTSGFDASAAIQQRWSSTYIVFITANTSTIPADFGGAHGVISKPFSRSGLMSALRYIEEGVCDPPPGFEAPENFTASPGFVASWSA